MGGGVGLVLGLIAVAFAQHATASRVHVVGNTTGWTLPQGGAAFYSDWAAKNSFVVGDSLTFNFVTNSHDVLRLITKESFDGCCADEAIDNVIATGPTTLKLDTAGVHYFICTVGRHCVEGQKLSVNVSAAPGGALPPSSNAPSPQPTTPPTATAPSHNDAFAPTPTTPPANSPSSSPPKGGGSQPPPPPPPSPPPSSSTAVILATLYVSLSAIFMTLLF